MKPAATKQKSRREYQKSGHYKRLRSFKRRGFDAINGQTYAGREAKRWRRWAIQQKGNGNCPLHVRQEIDLCTFDLWLLLELGESIAQDAKARGAVINKRRRELPKIHEDYNTVSIRFERRREALELEKGGLDLARRLMLEKANS